MKKNFAIQDIINEKFGRELYGYSPQQIDHFLDLIVEDYATFQKEIHNLSNLLQESEQIVRSQREVLQKNQVKIDNLNFRLKKYLETE